MTGWFSTMDVQMWNELQIVRDIINERGGITIGGQKYEIELLVEDCKSSLDGVTAATNSLIYNKGVKFIVGPAAFFSMAAAPVADPNKVIHVLGYCTDNPLEIGPQVPYGFLGYFGSEGRMRVMTQILKQKYPSYKNLAMVSPAGGINDYLRPKVKAYLAAQGYNLVGEWVVFPDDAADYSPYASKINAIKDADCIFWLNAIAAHIGNMAKAFRSLGNNKLMLVGATSSGNTVMRICGKDAANNIITLAPMANPGNPAVLNEIIKRITTKYGGDAPFYLENSAALYTLIQVIKAAQSIDPTVVKTKWESMDNVDTVFGPGIICGDQTYGIKHHGIAHGMPAQLLDKGQVSFYGWYNVPPIP
jgi:branched-chain amino acid transport system substrate-binding protein